MTEDPIQPHHETRDVNVRVLAWTLVGVAAMVGIVLIGVWWMYGYIRAQDQVRDVRRTLIPPPSPVPPEPRLQLNPADDYQAYKREQDHILNTYGWVSREDGRVRIPIQRAMELLIQRGVPARSATAKEKQ
jgi:hypothetical protein